MPASGRPVPKPGGLPAILGVLGAVWRNSRTWGLVERWRLEGRVAVIYFSYNRGSFRPFPWIKEVRAERIGKRS